MTTTQANDQAAIRKQINELLSIEICVETNDGTFSAAEACRCVGTGDPAFATRNVYETVGGKMRSTGPSEDSAPGRMRPSKIARESLADYRRQVSDLRAKIKSIK